MMDTKASLGGEHLIALGFMGSSRRSLVHPRPRSNRMSLHMLRSWKMDQLFLGVIIRMAVTAHTIKTSSRMSNLLLPLRWPFVQSLMMDKLLPGVVMMKAATAEQFKVNCLH